MSDTPRGYVVEWDCESDQWIATRTDGQHSVVIPFSAEPDALAAFVESALLQISEEWL